MRGAEQLLDTLNRNLAWRKKELSTLHLLSKVESEPTSGYVRRGALALLYAHWEGFVGDTGKEYLRFLSASEHETARLRDPFLALSLRGSIRQAGSSESIADHAKLIARMRASISTTSHRSRVPWRGVISIKSNLNVSRLKSVVAALGLDYEPYRLKEVTVIAAVVRSRNIIAHGKGKPVEAEEYSRLHSEVLLLMDCLRDQVSEAASVAGHLLSGDVPDGWHL